MLYPILNPKDAKKIAQKEKEVNKLQAKYNRRDLAYKEMMTSSLTRKEAKKTEAYKTAKNKEKGRVSDAKAEAKAEKARVLAEKQRAAEAQKQARLIDAESRLALDNAVKREARQLLAKSQSLIRMPCLPAARVASVLIENTKLQNTMICQPQQRNTSGRIFGG